MTNIQSILLVITMHVAILANAQIQFIGFDHPTCLQQSSYVYTYSNYTNGGGGSGTVLGYNIFRNGVAVFGESGTLGNGKICKDLVFVNDSIGFLVTYSGNMAISVLRTEDYGVNWTLIGGGAPNYFGMYVVNYTTAYVVTQWDTPMQLYVAKCSSFASEANATFVYDQTIETDVYRSDTLLYSDMCGFDSLNIMVQNGADTVTYHINMVGLFSSLESELDADDPNIKIFPNPASDYFSIEDLPKDIQSIRLRAMGGNEVLFLDPKNFECGSHSIEGLKPGVYMVEILCSDKTVYAEKLLVIGK